MTPLFFELAGLLAQGDELAGGDSLASAAVQGWLSQRGRLFAEIDRSSAQMDVTERKALDSLIGQILVLDAKIIAKAETEMGRVSGEIAHAQRLKTFLAGGVKPAQTMLLRRVL